MPGQASRGARAISVDGPRPARRGVIDWAPTSSGVPTGMTGEFELLEALAPVLEDGPGVLVGPGDDAAVVRVGDTPVVFAADTMVDGVHVDRDLSSLADLGFKALAVNVSDVAAMAARPAAALVSLQRPDWFGVEDARRLYEGLGEAADRWSCPLVGGDVVGAVALAVAVSIIGRPAADDWVLRRDGASPGDVVVVVGPLGLAAAGLRLLRVGDGEVLDAHPELAAAHRRPVAMAAAVDALVAARPSAGIDVSDGLGRDLGHLAAASGVGIRLEPDRLPVAPGVAAAADSLGVDAHDLVVGGGDDYALALTLPGDRLGRLDTALAGREVSGRVVGEVVEGRGVELDGRPVHQAGWEHAGAADGGRTATGTPERTGGDP